ncbi:hypothetical protein AB0912_00155 [Streptomyces sp. NPDC007084]|uniref:hypothetical protein n=1 Tax=Streptomyces sp. NPDC007084 TaxID=3154313 RepID=UPI0034545DFD
MTSSAVQARDTPGRTAAPEVVGLLVIDADHGRARYDCHRPNCLQRREGPVYGAAIPDWSKTVKAEHLARYHQGEQP